jgi:hypothetical protein
MTDVERKKALTTADLAAAARPIEARPGPGPVARREYEEPPRPKKPAQARPEKSAVPAPAGPGPERHPLFSEEETRRFRSEWDAIQIGFVDEPRNSVAKADGLVASVIQRLAEGFSQERSRLEKQWDRGEDASTEDLRVNLQRYRSFFDRLLSL